MGVDTTIHGKWPPLNYFRRDVGIGRRHLKKGQSLVGSLWAVFNCSPPPPLLHLLCIELQAAIKADSLTLEGLAGSRRTTSAGTLPQQSIALRTSGAWDNGPSGRI